MLTIYNVIPPQEIITLQMVFYHLENFEVTGHPSKQTDDHIVQSAFPKKFIIFNIPAMMATPLQSS